jgi:hypothetical protein
MIPITPLDYWRAGWELWIATWKVQVEINQRMAAAMLGSVAPEPLAPANSADAPSAAPKRRAAGRK